MKLHDDVAMTVLQLPDRPCYCVSLVKVEDGEDVTYDVTLVPTTIPGWTYDAYVVDRDRDGHPRSVYAVTPGGGDPTPEHYARAAVQEVRGGDAVSTTDECAFCQKQPLPDESVLEGTLPFCDPKCRERYVIECAHGNEPQAYGGVNAPGASS